MYCWVRDTVEHAWLSCRTFRRSGAALERMTRAVKVPDAVVKMMCRHLDGWNEVAKYVTDVMESIECDSKI